MRHLGCTERRIRLLGAGHFGLVLQDLALNPLGDGVPLFRPACLQKIRTKKLGKILLLDLQSKR